MLFSEIFITSEMYNYVNEESINDLEININNEHYCLKSKKQKLYYHPKYLLMDHAVKESFYVGIKPDTKTTIKLQFMFNGVKHECETTIGGGNSYQKIYSFRLVKKNKGTDLEHFELVEEIDK